MSPCQRPSALRRTTLTAPMERARGVTMAQQRAASNLCGTVTMTPSTLGMRSASAKNAARSAARTCNGTTMTSAPRARSDAVTPCGDFTCAIGSPTMKITRVAPE
jgi:hypothetical protein